MGKWKQSGIFSPQKYADYVVFSWKIKNDPRGKDWNSFFYLEVFVFFMNILKHPNESVQTSVQLGNLFST